MFLQNTDVFAHRLQFTRRIARLLFFLDTDSKTFTMNEYLFRSVHIYSL